MMETKTLMMILSQVRKTAEHVHIISWFMKSFLEIETKCQIDPS